MREPAGVEKEPQSAQNMTPEKRVEQMFVALKAHKPVFILAVLPTDGSNSALYGLILFLSHPSLLEWLVTGSLWHGSCFQAIL